jgi:chemosensory pili system protein ChpA (sensor histidine kinase/response regulator)
MDAMQTRSSPRVNSAIGAVKDGVAAEYRKLASELPGAAAYSRWEESHGALRIIAHPALIRLSEETGNLLAYARGAAVDPQLLGAAVNGAGAAILAYMDDLAAGLPDRPMRLVPAYRGLLQARGVQDGSPSDLFYPDLDREPPARPAPISAGVELLRAERRRFEAGLLRWLRNVSDSEAIDDMRAAIAAVEASRDTVKARAPWCAALAAMEVLASGALKPDPELRRFVSQLNMQIARAIDGSAEFPELLFRQALYFVALATPLGAPARDLATEIRRAYALDGMLDRGAADAQSAPAIPTAMANELKRLNEAWGSWAEGQTHADTLRAAIDVIEHGVGMLSDAAGAELLADISSALRMQLASGQPAPEAAVEISSALLMLENLIEDAPRASPSFASRAANARARLQACISDRAALQRLPAMELLDMQARTDETKALLSHTLAQANAVISEVELVLKAFFTDARTRGSLAALDRPLAQCAGMFTMLQDESGAAAICLCRQEIEELAASSGDDAAIKDRLARRVTALADYIGTWGQGDAKLDVLLARAGLGAPVATAEAPKIQRLEKLDAALAMADGGDALDKEMLEIFLEEAVEVLATVQTTLPESQHDPDNSEHLTSLRRAFHTLKGSGRMVGLTNVGEAAWEIEQVFNKLTQDGLSGTDDLYRLVALAHESFARWVAELRASGRTSVDAAALTDWARRLRAGERLPALAPISEPSAGMLTAAPHAVQIGSASVSAVLYGIFIEEAHQHTAVLKRFGGRIESDPTAAAHPDFLRAAHTLCGISATVGFDPMSELASGLERTLLRAEKAGSPLDTVACSVVACAVERLSQMVARIAQRESPEAEPALVDALNKTASTMRANAVSAVPRAPAVPPAANAPAVDSVRLSGERRITRLDDDIDQDLLAVFLTEAEELLPHIGQDLRDWRARPADKLVPESLQRLLHTLKGSSRMAGAMAVGELTHRMETRVENGSRLAAVPESLHHELEASYDRLNELIDELHSLELAPGDNAQKLPENVETSSHKSEITLTGDFRPVTATTATQPVLPTGPTQPTAPGLAVTGPLNGATDPRLAAAANNAATNPASAGMPQRAVLRVRAESAERLANQAGEVAIARARAESELRGARGAMRELTDNIIRLRGQLREIEMQAEMQMQSRIAQAEETDARFDPLEFDRFTRLQELTRLMAESVNDVATVQQNLMRNLDEGEAALGAQARTTRELQDDLVRIRMAPFSSLSDRLYRVARLASKDVGKRVRLDIRGAQSELDRGVLDRISPALEHLLRNSIAHGIEPGSARTTAGKPETGEIVIEVRQEGNEVVLGIADDGAGLDIARIRAKALAKGLMQKDEVLSDAQIADFIFRSGFSTAESVSEIAGRGVGLDVVRNEISSLGGRIEMAFERGKGTRFTIYLSLTLAVLKAVVIRVGEEIYALPSLLVEQVQSLKPEPLATAYSAREIFWRDERYPVYYLAHLLAQTKTAASQQRYSPILLLRSGPHRAAIHVDQLLGSQEIVVKNVGPQLARVAGVTGAAVLAGGETVLILNPVPLAHRAALAGVPSGAPDASSASPGCAEPIVSRKTSEPPAPRAAAPVRQATVLVVDDSLTVRKITSRTLTREGYNVVVAKDGIEALEKMQTRAPDVIVTDIEMPRMDGFDLTRNIRADPRLKDLPVIMITSRTADKHREHAAELGVTVFLGKPYEERQLLENISGAMRIPA